MLFSLCFAIQPDGKSDEAGNKEKMLVHAIPFMILEMGLLIAQVRKIKLQGRTLLKILKLDYFSFFKVAVVSFGRRVAWKQTRTEGQTIPRWFINASIIHVILMGAVTAIKLIFQVFIFNIIISGSSYNMNVRQLTIKILTLIFK